jgi:hypothetical protein
MGKHHRKPFPKKSSRASQTLDLVYSDVCDMGICVKRKEKSVGKNLKSLKI